MATTKVSDYALYKNGKWEGDVIHNLDIYDKQRKLEKLQKELNGKVTLVNMGTHFKIQDKLDRRPRRF